jgi:hypothetical protein
MENMSDLHLHIISFDIPYPANYGGVIDVYYKAKALAEKGVKVHLHCFQYGRKPSAELADIFYEVKYYKRDISKKHLFKSIPYIVSSRVSDELKANLRKDKHPILMEGLHTSSLLESKTLHKGRKMIVRPHNIEHEYYQNLAKVESDIFKKYYFYNESVKLKRYESILKKADLLLAISKNDEAYFNQLYENVAFIPAFHPFKTVDCKVGKGDFVLYHGNLSVAENTNAVKFLISNVFNDIDIPLKIAGLNPPRNLINLINNGHGRDVELISNPDDETLDALIKNAQINISITAQKTGLKLKLLNTLYNGRHCLVNEKMLSGSKLDELCIIANDHASMKRKIKSLFNKEFNEGNINTRKRKLTSIYNNGHNVDHLIELIS